MIALIPLVSNDYALAFLYVGVIVVALAVKRNPHDVLVFVFGFFIMIPFECLFVATGVETFTRQTLFGLLPLWLPLLWGYGFVAMKRSIAVLNV